MTNSMVRVFVFCILLINISLALPARAQNAIRVFTEPPSPQELAKFLFGPRYRSATALSSEKRFGLLVNFELDSVHVLPQSIPLLESLGEMLTLRSAGNEALVIEGYADSRGIDAHNLNLSTRRAMTIKRYLVESYKISPTRLVAIGKVKFSRMTSMTRKLRLTGELNFMQSNQLWLISE